MKRLLLLLMLACTLPGCKKNTEGPCSVKACFEYHPTEVTFGEIRFSNCSQNAVRYWWDFGDGTSSNEKEPVHIYQGSFPYTVKLFAYNGNKTDTMSKQITDYIVVYKPNIYIYPLTRSKCCVSISFPIGGNIIKYIPDYADGWCVDVEPSGRIDGQYNYLFYESRQPDLFQYKQGWCVARADLKMFFERNMTLYHFSEAEIKDFTDYWIPLLYEKDYYCIYPQTNEIINKTIQLDFSVQPDNLNRLFYGVVGVGELRQMGEPVIKPFAREGFHVMEWGLFRK